MPALDPPDALEPPEPLESLESPDDELWELAVLVDDRDEPLLAEGDEVLDEDGILGMELNEDIATFPIGPELYP